MSTPDWTNFDKLEYRRRIETFGADDSPVVASGPRGEIDGVCLPGELTDKGRQTTLDLGKRLRTLYVDQLKFMPSLIKDADMIYLRSSPMPRALESLQQTFAGLYPMSARTADFPPPTILTRTPADETLYPNESACRRFAQLSKAFAQRTADRWNESPDMEYLNKQIGKWMPPNSPKVAVDSHPRLSGIMDTVNSTLGHGPETRLPQEFYGEKLRSIIDKIGVEEWFSGYAESEEYRKVGVGALMGDVVNRMTGSVEHNGNDGMMEVGGKDGVQGKGRGGEPGIKLALSGCHDTSLAAALTSLGAFEGEAWPPYTSHVAFELFRAQSRTLTPSSTPPASPSASQEQQPNGWLSSLLGMWGARGTPPSTLAHSGIARKPVTDLTPSQKDNLKDYYVRIRYNDKVMKVPGCALPGNHLEGDDSFCTFEAFKSIVDKFTPKSWKEACTMNLDKPAMPTKVEPAGYAGEAPVATLQDYQTTLSSLEVQHKKSLEGAR